MCASAAANEIENLRATARTKAKTRGFCRARRRRVSKPPAAFLPINVEGRPSPDETEIQAIAEGLGLVVYSTGAQKICKYLDSKSRTDIPLRDMKIAHDWSGFYYDGTVYTDAEEEEMIRKQFNIPM